MIVKVFLKNSRINEYKDIQYVVEKENLKIIILKENPQKAFGHSYAINTDDIVEMKIKL